MLLIFLLVFLPRITYNSDQLLQTQGPYEVFHNAEGKPALAERKKKSKIWSNSFSCQKNLAETKWWKAVVAYGVTKNTHLVRISTHRPLPPCANVPMECVKCIFVPFVITFLPFSTFKKKKYLTFFLFLFVKITPCMSHIVLKMGPATPGVKKKKE